MRTLLEPFPHRQASLREEEERACIGSYRDRDLNKQAKWTGKFNECRQQETSKGPTWLTGIHSSTPPFPVINRNSCGAVKPMTAVNANPPSLIG